MSALVAALLEGDDKQRLERTGERLRRRRPDLAACCGPDALSRGWSAMACLSPKTGAQTERSTEFRLLIFTLRPV